MTASPIDWDEIDALYDKARAADVSGDTQTAIELYRAILKKDSQDHLGVGLRLAPLAGEKLQQAPSAYVATLFDQNADMFESILVDQLGYGVPLLIAQALQHQSPNEYKTWLDLGCGTGLCAIALEAVTQERTGIDLAPNMIEIADELELYQHLLVGEAVAFLESRQATGPYDLVTAADVLPYLGDLEPLFSALDSHVVPASLFAFSSERLETQAANYDVGQYKRFAHASHYIEQILHDHGWSLQHRDAITVRLEQGTPVPGELIIAQKN